MTDQLPPSNDTQTLGKVMTIAAWVLALVLMTLFFNAWNKQQRMNTEVKVLNVNGLKKTVLTRNVDNQYIAQGNINGKVVLFLVDTGATEVVIPENIAKKLKLTYGMEMIANTAGGSVTVYETHIEELTIGSITLHNLNATINPHAVGDEILLGMSALKRVTFQQDGDDLILTERARRSE